MAEFDLDTIPWPQSIRGINGLDRQIKEAMYRSLIPGDLLDRFGVDPRDRTRLHIHCPHDTRSVEIVFFHQPDAHDPVL